MDTASPCMIYVTAPDRDEALRIGRTLVEERLAACANVVDGVTSVYWWEGEVQEDAEASLILKSRRELVAALVARVKALHSYSCPCVVQLPIQDGNPEFLSWIVNETK